MLSKERYYINTNGNPCLEDDVTAEFLLVAKGSEVEDRDAAKFGFVDGLIESKEQPKTDTPATPIIESKEAPKVEAEAPVADLSTETKEEPQKGK